MFKSKNPYFTITQFILLFLSLFFLKNSIIELILSLVLFSTTFSQKYKKLAKITLFTALFNTFCGKLTFFCNILLLIDTILWITLNIKKRQILSFINSISGSIKLKKTVIKLIYFPKYYQKNLKTKNTLTNNKSIILTWNQNYKLTVTQLKNLTNTFERRLYFSSCNKSYEYSKKDLVPLIFSILIFIFFVTIGGVKYALFN